MAGPIGRNGGASISGREAVPAAERPQIILLVDDEQDILVSLQALLEAALKNVRVLTAETGAKGLEFLKKEAVDLILTDYKMPGMNGLEFMRQARDLSPNVPRILITAFPDLDLAIRAINEAAIENFLTKPFEPDQVISVVETVLRERRERMSRDQAFARSMDQLQRELRKKSGAA